jgi:adenosylcobinamide-GDP ribazoletransferase
MSAIGAVAQLSYNAANLRANIEQAKSRSVSPPVPEPGHPSPPDTGAAARWGRDFLRAAGFLTRLPVGHWVPFPAESEAATTEADGGDGDDHEYTYVDAYGTDRRPQVGPGAPDGSLAGAARAFPLVGLGLGLIGAAALGLARAAGLPPIVAAALAVAVLIAMTGALHEDGLADTVDGLLGGHDRAERLAIMRDSRIGTFAVLALTLSLIVRVGTLAGLSNAWAAMAAIVAAASLSRGALPVVMHAMAPARSDGLAVAAGRPSREHAVTAAVLGALIAVIALGFGPGLLAVVAAAGVGAAIAAFAQDRIGGCTGDVLGAIQQGCEIAVLVAACVSL